MQERVVEELVEFRKRLAEYQRRRQEAPRQDFPELRSDLAQRWGALRPDVQTLGVGLAVTVAGVSYPVVETAIQLPNARAPWINAEATAFALQSIDTAIGTAQRRRAAAAVAAPAEPTVVQPESARRHRRALAVVASSVFIGVVLGRFYDPGLAALRHGAGALPGVTPFGAKLLSALFGGVLFIVGGLAIERLGTLIDVAKSAAGAWSTAAARRLLLLAFVAGAVLAYLAAP